VVLPHTSTAKFEAKGHSLTKDVKYIWKTKHNQKVWENEEYKDNNGPILELKQLKKGDFEINAIIRDNERDLVVTSTLRVLGMKYLECNNVRCYSKIIL